MAPNVPTDGALWRAELARCAAIGRDLCEIGVFRGATLAVMCDAAATHGAIVHAVDSWEGMAEPGPMDGDEYPAGKFGTIAAGDFHRLMAKRGIGPGLYQCHRGWVPDVLESVPDGPFGFVHIDLDQYAPTIMAARWAWPRVAPGGVLAFHDWKPNTTRYAAAAVADWLHQTAGSGPVTIRTEAWELLAFRPLQ